MASSSTAPPANSPRCSLPGCHRPCHRDPQTGITHDYCGRTHANEAAGGMLAAPHGVCHTCSLPGCSEPVYFDRQSGRVHEFCSLTHSEEAKGMGLIGPSNRQRQHRPGAPVDPSVRCSLPGCTAPRFVDPANGFMHDFCGRTHAREASARGILPTDAAGGRPADVDRVWSGRPGEPKYVLSVLTNMHPRYEGVKQQFRDAWQHPTPLPKVVRVLQVRNPQYVYDRYASYIASVANEQRRFHGTSLGPHCSFGIDVTQPPCEDPGCAVCTICSQSFDLSHAGGTARSAGGFNRYGKGLYFSRVSSKSNDYAASSERENPKSVPRGRYRLMFMCKVAAGAEHRTAADGLSEAQVDDLVRARAAGGTFDSVVGLDADSGGSLNYEETVVYRNEAAIPSYLIVYEVP